MMTVYPKMRAKAELSSLLVLIPKRLLLVNSIMRIEIAMKIMIRCMRKEARRSGVKKEDQC